ncbi:hypothetical protein, partial [Streptomyces spectabilis]|uniref:hypothetical protein n=1 Tax=Streptomyces spectabilis TaxID=68270 RepID=UPI0033E2A1D8
MCALNSSGRGGALGEVTTYATSLVTCGLSVRRPTAQATTAGCAPSTVSKSIQASVRPLLCDSDDWAG